MSPDALLGVARCSLEAFPREGNHARCEDSYFTEFGIGLVQRTGAVDPPERGDIGFRDQHEATDRMARRVARWCLWSAEAAQGLDLMRKAVAACPDSVAMRSHLLEALLDQQAMRDAMVDPDYGSGQIGRHRPILGTGGTMHLAESLDCLRGEKGVSAMVFERLLSLVVTVIDHEEEATADARRVVFEHAALVADQLRRILSANGATDDEPDGDVDDVGSEDGACGDVDGGQDLAGSLSDGSSVRIRALLKRLDDAGGAGGRVGAKATV